MKAVHSDRCFVCYTDTDWQNAFVFSIYHSYTFHGKPCECISAYWAPVHLWTGSPSQALAPYPISDLRANENVSSVLWNGWLSAETAHKEMKSNLAETNSP